MKHKHPWRRSTLCLLIALCSFFSFVFPVYADIEWSGESGGSGNSGQTATSSDFYVIDTDYTDVVGYRFSLIDKEGNLEKDLSGEGLTKVQDIYATQSKYWKRAGIDSYHGGIQHNKTIIVNNYDNSYFRSDILSFKKGLENDQYNGALDKDIFTDSESEMLPPNPSEIGSWAKKKENLSPLVEALGYSLTNLTRGDNYVLVEPIFAVNLEGNRCALTISEIALYGYQEYLGGYLKANGNKGSKATACLNDSCQGCHFAFISNRTNRYFPSFLYETQIGPEKNFWKAGSELTSKATFETILQGGYGVGIAWGASENDVVVQSYTVTFSATPSGYGSVSRSSVTGVPAGSKISYSGSKATITGPGGSVIATVTASPAGASGGYAYSFGSWSTAPTVVNGNTSVVASFSRRTTNQITVSTRLNDKEWSRSYTGIRIVSTLGLGYTYYGSAYNSSTVSISNVNPGSYRIYILDDSQSNYLDTGVDITVTTSGGSAIIDYYTVTVNLGENMTSAVILNGSQSFKTASGQTKVTAEIIAGSTVELSATRYSSSIYAPSNIMVQVKNGSEKYTGLTVTLRDPSGQTVVHTAKELKEGEYYFTDLSYGEYLILYVGDTEVYKDYYIDNYSTYAADMIWSGTLGSLMTYNTTPYTGIVVDRPIEETVYALNFNLDYGTSTVQFYTIRYYVDGILESTQIELANTKLSDVLESPDSFCPFGYTISDWTAKRHNDASALSAIPSTLTFDLDLYATTAAPLSYTIHYDPNGGSGAPADQSYTITDDLYLSSTVPIRPGYLFAGWKVKSNVGSWTQGTVYESGQHIGSGMYGNITLVAEWKLDSFTVTFTVTPDGYGSVSEPSVTNVPYGSTIIYNNAAATILSPDGSILATVTATAAGQTAEYTYRFEDWTTAPTVVTGDTEVVASFTRETRIYTITYIHNGSEIGTQTYTYRDGCTLREAPEFVGHSFSGWKVVENDGNWTVGAAFGEKEVIPSETKYGDVTLESDWNAESYTVNFSATPNGYGSVSQAIVSGVPYGSSIVYSGFAATILSPDGRTLAIVSATAAGQTPEYTYSFEDWSVAPTTVTGNTSVVASFKRSTRTYTVTATAVPEGYGTVSQRQIADVPYGSEITYSLNRVQVNGVTVLAIASAQTAQYRYSFEGWTTAPTVVTGDTEVVASFIRVTKTYTVTVVATPDGYGSVSQTQITDLPYGATISYSGAVLTVNGSSVTAAPSPSTLYSDYRFEGWAKSDLSSFTTLTVTGNTTVYAVFERQDYVIVRFEGNASGAVGTMPDQKIPVGTTAALTANRFTYAGHGFLYWNYAPDGNDARINDRGSFTAPNTSGTVTLYAQWGLKVIYNANGGVVNSESYTEGSDGWIALKSTGERVVDLFLPGIRASLSPSGRFGLGRVGYTFAGWNTRADGSGKTFTVSQTLTASDLEPYCTAEGVKLYAVWTPITFTVHYDPNGGSGAPADQTKFYGVDLTLSKTIPTRPGYSFRGWGLTAATMEVSYLPGGSYRQNSSITLYAIWEKVEYDLLPITPNADYRKGTEVISSFEVVNPTGSPILPSHGFKVIFNVTDEDGNVLLTRSQTNIVCPAGETNLYYFRWTVPEYLRTGSKVRCVAKLVSADTVWDEAEIVNTVSVKENYVTPDTKFESNPGFTVPPVPSVSAGMNSAAWTRWEYVSGSFVKKNSSVSGNFDTRVDATMGVENSKVAYYDENGVLVIPSGYGFKLEIDDRTDKALSTGMQYGIMLVPEFGYALGDRVSRSLVYDEARSIWILNDSEKDNGASTYGDHHYTPLWYPDGDYTVQLILSDSWTPMGMLTVRINLTITIEGSVYDHWHIN